jgi:3-methyladenine DNA glycosylase AlkD
MKSPEVEVLTGIREMLQRAADPEKAAILSRFFKTGKGQYGEGDTFLGIMVPRQRKIAKQYHALPLKDLRDLLADNIHEHRLVALLILIERYRKSNGRGKKEIFDFYIKNSKHVNNWDLVDLSAGNILGDYLMDKDRRLLYRLARSKTVWERRMAIMATFPFIRKEQFGDTLQIAEMLLSDGHDLIHKAVGWMLREIGKRDQDKEETFLEQHYRKMPRTMLRFAIERFDEEKRKAYLAK